jgi:hypothetical protein
MISCSLVDGMMNEWWFWKNPLALPTSTLTAASAARCFKANHATSKSWDLAKTIEHSLIRCGQRGYDACKCGRRSEIILCCYNKWTNLHLRGNAWRDLCTWPFNYIFTHERTRAIMVKLCSQAITYETKYKNIGNVASYYIISRAYVRTYWKT